MFVPKFRQEGTYTAPPNIDCYGIIRSQVPDTIADIKRLPMSPTELNAHFISTTKRYIVGVNYVYYLIMNIMEISGTDFTRGAKGDKTSNSAHARKSARRNVV